MRKMMIIAFVLFFAGTGIALAEEGGMLRQGSLGFVAGGGQGGLGTKEVNEHQYVYLGAYFEAPIADGFAWRFTANYFGNAERGDAWYSSSTSGLSSRVETYRFLTGPSFSWEYNGWWFWDSIQGGMDHEIGEGFLPVTVVQNELMFGSGWFYNYLIVNGRIGDKDYESYYACDQAFIRLYNWLAVGPQIKYVWFNQYDREGNRSMVYEPAYGGQIRISEDALDPSWSLTIGGTGGAFVGTGWSVDFWMKF